MSDFFSQNRHLQTGLIPVCMAFCLILAPCRVDAGVMTAGSEVTATDLLCRNVSSTKLQGWNLASAAVVKSASSCLMVDLGSLDPNFGKHISGLRWVNGFPSQRFLLDTSFPSSVGGGGIGTVTWLICDSVFPLMAPSAEDWIRAMKLGSLLAVPPEELLKPPRD